MIMDVKNCFGCGSCAQICPRNCIKMLPDREGFAYPSVNQSECVKCGLCLDCCPSIKNSPFVPEGEQNFFSFVHANQDVVNQSSSGGAFTALAEAFCQEGACKIFGAKWNDDLTVSHASVDSISDIDAFRKSKYIQSDIGNTYNEVKNALAKGIKVVFSGTPCQVAGLKCFLKKDYEHLLLIDIVCHGVPNQQIFRRYIECLEKKYRTKVKQYIFRQRKSLWGITDPLASRILFEDGRSVDLYSFEDDYLKSYFNAIDYRLSCYSCPYASKRRVSDITIGDFWGIENYNRKYKAQNGVSLVIANTSKGNKLVTSLAKDYNIEQVPEKYALDYNRNLRAPSKLHTDRNSFIERIMTEDFCDVTKHYMPRISKFKFFISQLMFGKILKSLFERKGNL